MKKKVAQLEIETDLTNEQVLIACMALKSDDPPFEVTQVQVMEIQEADDDEPEP